MPSSILSAKSQPVALVAFILLLLALSGCGTSNEATTAYTQLSLISPPDTPYEEKQIPLDPSREVWRPGHWEYDGSDFNWIPGEMLARPNYFAVWSGDRWDKRAFGWAFVPGHWE